MVAPVFRAQMSEIYVSKHLLSPRLHHDSIVFNDKNFQIDSIILLIILPEFGT